ncbi:ComEC/Rec2 family competence protein [Patescibacteria group bacterium]|nr:ComEC/Rec2 family competence protein [Patescibacteria group bacterium]
MLIGERSYLAKEDYQSFISSGLVHIIAVSGGNIVLIVAFLSAILFFIPYYIRLTLISAAIVLYACICGFDSSVVRAVTMALIGIMALFV